MMKILKFLFELLVNTYFTSATPNLFGSKKRRKDKELIADTFKTSATETQDEIQQIESQNPFDSAANKLAMKKAVQGARQMQTRGLNVLGAGATPEAIIAAQGAASEAQGAAAGQIAAGAEATQKSEIASLRNLEAGQMAQYGSMAANAASERGSGWNTFFQGLDAIGGIVSGVASAGSGAAGAVV